MPGNGRFGHIRGRTTRSAGMLVASSSPVPHPRIGMLPSLGANPKPAYAGFERRGYIGGPVLKLCYPSDANAPGCHPRPILAAFGDGFRLPGASVSFRPAATPCQFSPKVVGRCVSLDRGMATGVAIGAARPPCLFTVAHLVSDFDTFACYNSEGRKVGTFSEASWLSFEGWSMCTSMAWQTPEF